MTSPDLRPDTPTEPSVTSTTTLPTAPPTPVPRPRIGFYARHLLVCNGPRCDADGQSQAVLDALGPRLQAAGLDQGELRVKRSRVSCFAACKGGPIVCVQPDGTWYHNVTLDNLDRIIAQHLLHGQVVADLVFHQGPGSQAPAAPATPALPVHLSTAAPAT